MAATTFAPTATEIDADHIMFIGRGKSHSMVHLIEGPAKSKKDTYSVCGQSVKNTGREPRANDTICKRCQTEPAVEIVETAPVVSGAVIEPQSFTLNASLIDATDAPRAVLVVVDEAHEIETVDATAEVVETIVTDACYHCGETGATESEEIDGDRVMVHKTCQPKSAATVASAPRSTKPLVTKADGTPKWRIKRPCSVCGRLMKIKRGTEVATHVACR